MSKLVRDSAHGGMAKKRGTLFPTYSFYGGDFCGKSGVFHSNIGRSIPSLPTGAVMRRKTPAP
jgi:hypothetical protein